jgi:hypothetical protein
VGEIWKSLEMHAREALECSMQSLMGDPGGSSQDQSANRNVDSEVCAPEVSDGNKDSIGYWTTGHVCSILANELSTFSQAFVGG